MRRGAEGVLVALAIGCAIAGYTLVDKEGLRHAGSLPYLELVLIPVGLVALPVVAARRGTQALRAQLTASTARRSSSSQRSSRAYSSASVWASSASREPRPSPAGSRCSRSPEKMARA